MLSIPMPDFLGLVTGETIVAETDRGEVFEGDEHELVAGPVRDAPEVKPAYRRWVDHTAPSGSWTGVVIAVHPAQALDAASGSSRHLLSRALRGDVVVLRVFDGAQPVLSETAFAARLRSIEGALRV